MDASVDATAQEWMRQGLAETTPDQYDLLRELDSTKPEPDVYAVWSLNLLLRLIRLFQARYQGFPPVRTSDSQTIYSDLRLRLLNCLALAGLPQEHDLARRAFPEQLTDLDDGGLEQRGDDRQRLIDWFCDHCQQRGLMRYREALTGFFAETDRRIAAIHLDTWLANFPDRKHVPLPPLGESMAQYRERAQREIQARMAERKAWEDLPAHYRTMDAELRALTPGQRSLLYALAEARNLCARVGTKLPRADGDIVFEHPADHEDYILLRTQLIDALAQAGHDDLAAWVTSATPERLADVMSDAGVWDSAGMQELDDRLFQLVAQQGLNQQLDLVIRESLRDDINVRTRAIAQETRAANARPASELWTEALERAVDTHISQHPYRKPSLPSWWGKGLFPSLSLDPPVATDGLEEQLRGADEVQEQANQGPEPLVAPAEHTDLGSCHPAVLVEPAPDGMPVAPHTEGAGVDRAVPAPNGAPGQQPVDDEKAGKINAKRLKKAVEAARFYIDKYKKPPSSANDLFTKVPRVDYRTWQRWKAGWNGVVFEVSFDEVIALAQKELASRQA